jgi:hypothetical protein
MMTSGSPRPSLVKSKQRALVLISLMVLSQFIVLIPSVAADIPATSTLITTFSNGNDTVTIEFDGSTSAALEIPQNTTVEELSFKLEYLDDTMTSPGQVWLDMNQDGITEWEYNGTGYGGIGSQTRFSDNSSLFYSSMPVGAHNGPDILLPQDSIIQDSLLAIDYVPENNGIWMNESSIVDMATLDYDNDSSEEVIVLNTEWETGNGDLVTAIGWMNNNSNNDGFTNISWHQTCNDVENLEIADFNGDGYDDVLVWTPIVGRFCYHIWIPSQESFSSSQELTGGSSGQDIIVSVGDVNLDGFDDVIFADTFGSYGYYQWKQSLPGFELIDEYQFETTVGGISQTAGISQLDIGNIMGGNINSTVVVVSDIGTVETLMWDLGSNAFAIVYSTFDNFDMDFLWLVDLNGDTFDEIVTWGSGTTGVILISDYSLGIYGTISQTGLEAPVGATVVDFNADGVLDILIPENATADDDDNTMNGSLMIYNLIGGVITDSNKVLTPRTMPVLVISGDMNGDNNPELIVYCGEQEQSKGIFIDSWHKMSYDFDGDGIVELSVEGFGQAESGANGSQPLRVTDSNGDIANTIDLNKASYNSALDAYGNDIMTISSEITLNSAGSVFLQNLKITYDYSHHIEELYDGSGNNLTTLINSDYMEFGTQNFTVPLLFSSNQDNMELWTTLGEVNLIDLRLVTSPGHPELPDLDPLVLNATNVEEDSIEMRWSEVTTGNQHFDSYELYRSSTVNATFPGDYNLLSTASGDHTDVSYTDSGLPEGAHYEYVVRATFAVGGLYSAISNVIIIDLPSVPSVKNVIAVDTPLDEGLSIDISWDEVDDRFSGYYDIFVLTVNFTDTTLLESVAILQNTDTSYSASTTSTVKDANGDIVTNAQYIQNEQALWVAVVATNDSGSNPYVTATGPVYALNNDELSTIISIDLSSAEIFGNEISNDDCLDEVCQFIVGGDQPTIISLNLQSIEIVSDESNSEPVENTIIMTTLIINPQDAFPYKFYFNSTTDDNGDSEIEFNWRDIANDSIGASGITGAEITAEYNGRAETLEQGGLAPSIEFIIGVHVVVPAYFSLLTTVVMVNDVGDATLEVSLIAEHDWQQAAFLGTEITFKYYDNELLTSTTKQSINSLGNLEVNIDGNPSGGYVLITPDSSANPNNPLAWKYLNVFELSATLVAYDGSGQTDLDDDTDLVLNDDDLCPNTPGNEAGQVNSEGCSPSQLANQIEIIDPELECPMLETFVGESWAIENIVNSQNPNLECELINNNNLFLTLEHPAKVTVGGIEIGINCPSFVGNESQVTCTFSPTVVSVTNKTTSEPVEVPFNVDFTFTWITPTGTSQMKEISLGKEFSLRGDITTVVDDNSGTDNTDGTDNGGTDNGGTGPVINEESVDTKAGILQDPMMLGLIAAGAIFALVSIIIIVRFMRGDDDDWDEDWDDDEAEEMENPLDRILGRSGGSSMGSSAQPQQEQFERDNSRGRLSGSAGEEFVRQSQQSSEYENDPGYSIDEDGTEWWEDEQGQWWYRDPNMDDWAEWNE